MTVGGSTGRRCPTTALERGAPIKADCATAPLKPLTERLEVLFPSTIAVARIVGEPGLAVRVAWIWRFDPEIVPSFARAPFDHCQTVAVRVPPDAPVICWLKKTGSPPLAIGPATSWLN